MNSDFEDFVLNKNILFNLPLDCLPLMHTHTHTYNTHTYTYTFMYSKLIAHYKCEVSNIFRHKYLIWNTSNWWNERLFKLYSHMDYIQMSHTYPPTHTYIFVCVCVCSYICVYDYFELWNIIAIYLKAYWKHLQKRHVILQCCCSRKKIF